MDVTQVGIYSKKELIGKGTFGKIFKAQKNGSQELVALKVVYLGKCGKKDKKHVQTEVELLQICQHKNLVQFIEAFSHENYMYIVMELCNGGNLRKYIRDNEGLAEEKCNHVLRQISDGLEYLHDQDIVHRDVKTTNILLQRNDGDISIKIGDFGLAKVMDTLQSATLTTCVGSPYFMSPEMINGEAYDKSTDIWSLGCCAYEMATTDVPYEAKEIDGLKDRIKKDNVEITRMPYCQDMRDLIAGMMDKDKRRRPSVENIITFLHQHNHTPIVQEHKGRRKIDNFASTWSPGTSRQQITDTDMLNNRPSCHTSGYDTSEDKEEDGGVVVVQAPVRMTEDERDWLANAEQLQNAILKRIGDTHILDKINNAIERTKHMDNSDVFMADMEKLLNKKSFDSCKPHLGALWFYRTELLKKNFKIAWS